MSVYSGLLHGIRQNNTTPLAIHLQSLKPYVKFLRNAYFQKPVVVPYDKVGIQEAYLLTYLPHYYQLIYQIFLGQAPDFFKGKKAATVSFIGGGPGSEIYGLCRYIANNAKEVKQLTVNLFDLHADTWQYSHKIVDADLIRQTLSKDVKFSWHSFAMDMTKRDTVVHWQKQLAASDVVVVQNCLNEIPLSLLEHTTNNLKEIFGWLHPKAMLLLADMTSTAKDAISKTEKKIVAQFSPVFHRSTLVSGVSGSMISTEHWPPLEIRQNLLTGENGLIPRKNVKYDYSVLSKAYAGYQPEQAAVGFAALYGPLDFAHLDVNNYARSRVFVGIDFGTSTTAVSAVHINADGLLELEPLAIRQKGPHGSEKRERLVPCVVAKKDGALMVGKYAAEYKRFLTYGVDCWHSFKANLGQIEQIAFPDSALASHATHKIATLDDALHIFLKYLYREVSQVLQEMFPGKEPMYALSVPAGFGAKEKKELKTAIIKAGFDCADVPFIEEPNAALVHYFFKTNTAVGDNPFKVMVLDVGAGTVDLSILEAQKQGSEVTSKLLAVHRDGEQGGDWIDRQMAALIINSDKRLTSLNHELQQSLIASCEELKIMLCKTVVTDRRVGFALSTNAQSDDLIALPNHFETASGALALIGLSYRQFDAIMNAYWEGNSGFLGIKTSLLTCLKLASLQVPDIDKVIVTGGGGRNPYLRAQLAGFFEADRLFFVDDIQEQVSRGTALHSFVVNSFGKPIITSLLNENYYVEVNGKKHLVFSKGDTYPTHDVGIFFSTEKLSVATIQVLKSEAFVYSKSFTVNNTAVVHQLVFYIDADQELRCEVVTATESYPAIENF